MTFDIKMVAAAAPDIILILLCAIACLYCFLLHRRLNKLNSLKSGVGASIISLTQAIENIYTAAQDAQTTTRTMIQSLDQMIMQAESTLTKLEAEKMAAKAQIVQTRTVTKTAKHITTEILPEQITKAKKTSQNLLDAITSLDMFRVKLQSPDPHPPQDLSPDNMEAQDSLQIHIGAEFFDDDYEASFQAALTEEAKRREQEDKPATTQLTSQEAAQLSEKIRHRIESKTEAEMSNNVPMNDMSSHNSVRKINFEERLKNPLKFITRTAS